MVAPAEKTRIFTLGLGSDDRQLLATRFSPFPQYEFSHHGCWSPDILHCDVILVNLDNPASQDALNMIREFKGVREPLLVLFSADDKHLSGMGSIDDADSVPGLCRRLRDVLPNIDCSRAIAPRSAVELLEGGAQMDDHQGSAAS
jgi:hypothetical protein